jgi:catechol 2,3-dioxygenase-like lactoylglutathione lyase family enzyme
VGCITGIDHVQVAAPPGCEAEARRFYGKLLGLDEIEKPEELRARGGVWFRCGGQELHVGVDQRFTPALKAHPAFAVTGRVELVAALEQAGVRVTWDRDQCYTADPWGNRLEILEACSSSPTPATGSTRS